MADIVNEDFAKEREEMLAVLTPTQRRRFEKYEAGMSLTEIAYSENADFNSVKEPIKGAQNKLKNFLKNI